MFNKNGNNSINNQPVIGITMGDPVGIGPEIIVKALADPDIRCLVESATGSGGSPRR